MMGFILNIIFFGKKGAFSRKHGSTIQNSFVFKKMFYNIKNAIDKIKNMLSCVIIYTK